MEIAFFRQEQLESVVDLLREMSVHYNRDNASSRDVIKANLVDNIPAPAFSIYEERKHAWVNLPENIEHLA